MCGWSAERLRVIADPGTTYRTRDDIKAVRSTRDPIEMCKQRMIEAGWYDAKEIKAMDKEIRAEVDVALAAALAAGPPPVSELMDNIYIEDANARAVELCESRVVGVSSGPDAPYTQYLGPIKGSV